MVVIDESIFISLMILLDGKLVNWRLDEMKTITFMFGSSLSFNFSKILEMEKKTFDEYLISIEISSKKDNIVAKSGESIELSQ